MALRGPGTCLEEATRERHPGHPHHPGSDEGSAHLPETAPSQPGESGQSCASGEVDSIPIRVGGGG